MYCWVIVLGWRNVLLAYSGLKDCIAGLAEFTARLQCKSLLYGYTSGRNEFTARLYFWAGRRNVQLGYTSELEEFTARLYCWAGGMLSYTSRLDECTAWLYC